MPANRKPLRTSTRNADADPTAREGRLWLAVCARDQSMDGTFYYSVATTGIYCRPSCPARRPIRGNVQFHDTPDAAERAGFRPCKRCRPKGQGIEERQTAKIVEACRMIEAADEAPILTELAAATDLSPFHFHRLFKAVTGVTPKAYANANRHKRLKSELKEAPSVTRAIHNAGFNSSAAFYSVSTKVLGMKPQTYRKGGANEVLRFAIAQGSLGAILVAATDKGVAAILLGDEPETLLAELHERFPKAELIVANEKFERLAQRAIACVENPTKRFDLPLDIKGTAFQHRVWQALRDIPCGETASYTDLAQEIGSPKSVRAVARACAANPVAIAIPCHRVVRADGALSGYRWGIARKRALLDRERKATTKRISKSAKWESE